MASNPNLATELQTGTAEDLSIDDFSALLQKEFKPKSDEAKSRVEMAVRTLAEQALAGSTIVSTDVLGTIESMISSIDRKLSELVALEIRKSDRFVRAPQPSAALLIRSWRDAHGVIGL